MPEITTPNPLRELIPIDDVSAARIADPQTHAEFLESILASDPEADLDRTGRHRPATPARPHHGRPDDDRRRRSRRPLLIAGLAAAIAATLILIVPGLSSDSSSPGPLSADAAVVKGAIDSLATKPNTIVTVRQRSDFVVSGKRKRVQVHLEDQTVWIGTDGTIRARRLTISQSNPSYTIVQASNRATFTAEFFDPMTDAIYKTRMHIGKLGVSANPNQYNPVTIRARLAAQLKSLLRSGTLKVTGEKVVDGQQALVLRCAPNCDDADQAGIEYDVARDTYDLIREIDGGGSQSTTIQEFRTERATPANERQFDLTNAYPHAEVLWVSENEYITRMSGAFSGR